MVNETETLYFNLWDSNDNETEQQQTENFLKQQSDKSVLSKQKADDLNELSETISLNPSGLTIENIPDKIIQFDVLRVNSKKIFFK